MGSCNYQESCRFYRTYSQARDHEDDKRLLYERYCAADRADECAIHLHVQQQGTAPPSKLLPNGSYYVDTATIRHLAAAALAVALLACLSVIFVALW